MDNALKDKKISELRKMLDDKEISSVELTRYCLGKIAERDGEVNAYLEVYEEDALEEARRADERISQGDADMLTGIPYSVKDNILYEGRRSCAGSLLLENHRGVFDAFAVRGLRRSGAVCLGRTNMDEFAMGSSTEYSAYGPTKNPLDLSRVPGGTSGGAGASVSYGGATFALGSDTAGSIRQPASFCGVVGLKPTYGAVSRNGLIALGSSLDCIGPITNSVDDAKIVFESISGHDAKDSTSVPFDRRSELKGVDNKKIGVPFKFLESEGVSDYVRKNFEESLEVFKGLGYEIVDIDIPNLEDSLAVYYIILPAEASSNLARFDGVRYGFSAEGEDLLDTYKKTRAKFGPEARRRIILGSYVLSSGYYDEYYGKATRVRNLITKQHLDVLKKVSFILTPTTTEEAFEFGAKKDPVSMYMSDLFTVSANITGLPALSIPSGNGPSGMPLSVQLTGGYFSEDLLFDLGGRFEKEISSDRI